MKTSKFLPPSYFFIYLLLAVILHFFLPIRQLVFSPGRYSGILLVIVGSWLAVWSENLFKKRNTTVNPFEKPKSLVKEGPYRLSRHPMYLGMTITLFGAAVILGSVSAFLFPPAFFITLEAGFIPPEEKAMEETFGEEYLSYKKRVRRWI